VLDSGCCGMAGSFGFEAGHYDISVAIGERRLLPAVREASEETLIVADGFSCKTQVAELTDRRALHLAQVMSLAREHGPDGLTGAPPESGHPDVQPPSSKPALAAAAAAGIGAAAGCAAWLRRRS
jgi:hypothetical protein